LQTVLGFVGDYYFSGLVRNLERNCVLESSQKQWFGLVCDNFNFQHYWNLANYLHLYFWQQKKGPTQ